MFQTEMNALRRRLSLLLPSTRLERFYPHLLEEMGPGEVLGLLSRLEGQEKGDMWRGCLMSPPKKVTLYHICQEAELESILEDGFRKGTQEETLQRYRPLYPPAIFGQEGRDRVSFTCAGASAALPWLWLKATLQRWVELVLTVVIAQEREGLPVQEAAKKQYPEVYKRLLADGGVALDGLDASASKLEILTALPLPPLRAVRTEVSPDRIRRAIVSEAQIWMHDECLAHPATGLEFTVDREDIGRIEEAPLSDLLRLPGDPYLTRLAKLPSVRKKLTHWRLMQEHRAAESVRELDFLAPDEDGSPTSVVPFSGWEEMSWREKVAATISLLIASRSRHKPLADQVRKVLQRPDAPMPFSGVMGLLGMKEKK